MSYRVAVSYRGKTLPDRYTGVQRVGFAVDDGWPRVKLVCEKDTWFLSTADITAMKISEEESE